MSTAIRSYLCGDLYCENKSPEGPRDFAHCQFCNSFFLTATRGYLKRRLVYQPDDPLLYVFGLVDALGAAQYNRKVCHGIEISLMARFEAWRIKHEKQTGCYEPSEEVPF